MKYPVWKKILFNAWRAFGVSFLAVVVSQMQMGIDLSSWRTWIANLLCSAIAGGLSGVAKWLREINAEDYESFIFKLPA